MAKIKCDLTRNFVPFFLSQASCIVWNVLPKTNFLEMCRSQIASNTDCCLIAALLRLEAIVKCLILFYFYLMPGKLEFEQWMILEMDFNILNTNRKRHNLKPVISLQSDQDYQQRDTKGDQLDTTRCKSESVCVWCTWFNIYETKWVQRNSFCDTSGCSFTECLAGFLLLFLRSNNEE